MESNDDIEEDWHKLLLGVRRSTLYHNRRVKFFDGVRKRISMLVLISGFGTITMLLAAMGESYVLGAAVLVSVMSAIDLVFEPASHARLHNDLKRRFINLEKKIIVKEESQKELARLVSQRLEIESDEPPVLRVLDVICHNDLMRSMGYEKKCFKTISPVQRCCANLFDFRLHTIKH